MWLISNNSLSQHVRIILWRFLLCLFLVPASISLQASPGDIIFSDNFERSDLGPSWTVNDSGGGEAGIGAHTSQSGTRSLYTRWEVVSVTSQTIDLSTIAAADLTLWIREGSDAFSEDPEKSNENLVVEYQGHSGTWTRLLHYAGNEFAGGNILIPTIDLPSNAMHANFRLRIRQTGGDGNGWDYYHLDDITITERAIAPAVVGGFCDDFEAGIGNWQISAITGDAGIGSHTYNSFRNSLYLRNGSVSVTSIPVDLSAGTGEVTYWVRRGSDRFSEDPDGNENLAVEYLNKNGDWVTLDVFSGRGSPGEEFSVTHELPVDAQHDRLRLRFSMLDGSGNRRDYWHVDDVCISSVAPPEAFAYYTLDVDGLGDVSDSSGNSNDGVVLGRVTYADSNPVTRGDPGTCGYMEVPFNNLASVQDAIDTGIDIDSEIGNVGTIEFWYKSNQRWNGNRGDRQLFDASASYNGNGTGQKFFSLMLGNNSRLRFALEDVRDYNYQVETGNNNYRAGAWVHIATTWNLSANQLQIYINGALEGSANISSNGQLGNVDSLYFGDNRSSYLARSTGNSANGSFDEIRIYNSVLSREKIQVDMNATHPCAFSRIDHYVISHSGQGVTCEAEPVEIRVHDSTHAEVIPNAGHSIILSAIDVITGTAASDASWIGSGVTDLGGGQAHYTFTGSESKITAQLRNVSEARLNINVIDSDGITENSGNTNEIDNDLVFSDTAFRFYANGLVNAIGTQIADKNSAINPGAQLLTLRAVQTNSLTGACEARLNGSQNVEMAFQCIDPGNCKTANGVTINAMAIADNPASGVFNYSDVSLNFGVTGTAAFLLNYADAGRIQLHARKALQTSDNDPGPAITLTGTSNPFTVKPAGLCVQSSGADAGCIPPYYNCTKFIQAGRNFNLSVFAVGWEAMNESNSEFCSGNSLTPNFTLSNIAIRHSLIAPASGVYGSIAIGSTNINLLDNGIRNLDQSVSEVGVFIFTASPPAYHGETIVPSSSDAIGRFYPEDFQVTVNEQGLMAPACSGFTYTGQPMGYLAIPVLLITARNVAGATTQNYTGDFSKLRAGNGSSISFSPPASDASQIGKDLSTLTQLNTNLHSNLSNIIDNANGTLNYPLSALDEFTYIRNTNAEITPYTSNVDLPLSQVIDSDGVRDDGTAVVLQPTGVEMRYGRLVMDDAYGPQTDDLALPVRAEYLAGSGFTDNTDDYCTIITPTTAVSLSNWQGNLSSGETSVSDSSGLLAGSGEILLSAPGVGAGNDTNDGSVDLTLDLSTTSTPQIWLLNDENGDGVYAENPSGTASFGMYRGDDRFLYWRETQ